MHSHRCVEKRSLTEFSSYKGLRKTAIYAIIYEPLVVNICWLLKRGIVGIERNQQNISIITVKVESADE